MSTEANKALVRDFWGYFFSGDADAAFACMSDDFEWTLIGSTPISGTFRGKDEITKKFLNPVMERLDTSAPFSLDIIEMIAEGDKVVVRAEGHMSGRFGPYNNTYCHVMTVRGGKLTGTVEYVDTSLVTTALYADYQD